MPGMRRALLRSGCAVELRKASAASRKARHVGVQQRAVQRRRRAGARAREADVDLQVAARHAALDDGADVVLQRIQFGRQVEVQIQAAMVHALQAEDDLALRDLLSDAGKARHAAYAHRSTTDPASSNWSSWSR